MLLQLFVTQASSRRQDVVADEVDGFAIAPEAANQAVDDLDGAPLADPDVDGAPLDGDPLDGVPRKINYVGDSIRCFFC